MGYRERMDNLKKEKQGKSNKKKKLRLNEERESFKHLVEAREQQIRKIVENSNTKIQDVLAKEDQMTAYELASKCKEIDDECRKKVTMLKNRLKKFKEDQS